MESALAPIFLKHGIPQDQHAKQTDIFMDCLITGLGVSLAGKKQKKPKRCLVARVNYACYTEGKDYVFVNSNEVEVYRTDQVDTDTTGTDSILRLLDTYQKTIDGNALLSFQSFPIPHFAKIKAVRSTVTYFAPYTKQYFEIEMNDGTIHIVGLSVEELYIAGKSRMEISTAVIQKHFIPKKENVQLIYKLLPSYSWGDREITPGEHINTNHFLKDIYPQKHLLMLSGTRSSAELVLEDYC